MLEAMLVACILVILGDVISHSAIWYKIGKLEKAVYNGNTKTNESKESKESN